MQAAFLRVKLRKLDEWNERRRAVADRYLAELDGAQPVSATALCAGLGGAGLAPFCGAAPEAGCVCRNG